MKLKYLFIGAILFAKTSIAQTLQSVTDNGSITNNFIKITGVNNVQNGEGLELFKSGTTSYIISYDRGGTSTFRPLFIQGSIINFHGNAVFEDGITGTLTGNVIGNSTTTSAVSGTTNFVPKFTSSNTLGNSRFSIQDNLHTVNWRYDSDYAALAFEYNYNPVIELSLYGQLIVPNGGIDAKSQIRNNGDYATVGGQRGFTYNTDDNLYGYPLVTWKTQNAEKMQLTAVGNLGIGISNPTDKLEVNGRIRNNGEYATIGGNTGFTYNTVDNLNGSPLVTWKTQNTEKMQLTALGNLGIGISNPADKLEVNGRIRTKEVRVEATGWPDFVFNNQYKLTSLSELDKFIQVNKHLPNIPTATEVEKNGIELGEMNKKLLQKIEELTLHFIEKDKELKNNSNKIAEIEAKLELLMNSKK